MTLAEYEHSVGPKNKHFHELAEAQYLAREGVIRPGEDDDDLESGSDSSPLPDSDPHSTTVRWSSDDVRKDRSTTADDVDV